jgi:hypothetical protein
VWPSGHYREQDGQTERFPAKGKDPFPAGEIAGIFFLFRACAAKGPIGLKRLFAPILPLACRIAAGPDCDPHEPSGTSQRPIRNDPETRERSFESLIIRLRQREIAEPEQENEKSAHVCCQA